MTSSPVSIGRFGVIVVVIGALTRFEVRFDLSVTLESGDGYPISAVRSA
jgi:hypothetical protein